MTESPFRDRFEQVLRKHLRNGAVADTIPYDTELVALGVDSLGTINLLFDIESAFGVAFPAALLTVETFRTPSTLATAVSTLVGARR